MPICAQDGVRSPGAIAPQSLMDALRAVSAGSLGDVEASEEAQAMDTSLPEQEAGAPEPEAVREPEPLSPSSPGESVVGTRQAKPDSLRCPTPSHVLTCAFTGAGSFWGNCFLLCACA